MPNTSNNYHEQTSTPAIRAYLGGSFDPVHNGHLEVALHVYQDLLPLATQQNRTLHVSLLPNARSPFKAQSTDPAHRLAMLRLAAQDTPIQINELELWQAPPVYTIDSVRALRQQYPHDCLIFIMGMDSAHSLDKWKDGLRLTDYVNLWVFNREDSDDINEGISDSTTSFENPIATSQYLTTLQSQLPLPLQPHIVDSAIELLTPIARCLVVNAETDSSTINNSDVNSLNVNSTDLKSAIKGRIYIDTRPITAVSSTQIREQLQILATETNKVPVTNRHLLNLINYSISISYRRLSS